jgi:subtilisin family serine protease
MEVSRAALRHRWWRVSLVVACVLGAATAGVLVASAAPQAEGTIVGAGGPDAVPNSYIVVFRPTVAADVVSRTESLAGQYHLAVRHTYTAAVHGFSAAMTASQARQLAALPEIKYVEQNHIIRIASTQTNPPSWGLDRVDQTYLPLDHSYTYSTIAANVHAYIIDTGIRLSHSDFGGRATAGVDEVVPSDGAQDCNGHGTHVAGILGGSAYGVAKGVSLVSVRVLNCYGVGTSADVVAGVDWVTANAIKPAVANMSLSGPSDIFVDDAVATSIGSGVTYIVAAGNNSADASTFSPADGATTIAVGATDINDNLAPFSNYGFDVPLYAPGVDIASDWNTSDTATQVLSGTSMATPFVAGAAALVLATNPTFTPSQVHSSLQANATQGVVEGDGGIYWNQIVYTGTTPAPAPAHNFGLGFSGTLFNVVLAPGHSYSGTTVETLGDGQQTLVFSAPGLPAGVSVSFNPPSIPSGSNVVPTVSVAPGTVPGWYSIPITATGSTITHALTMNLHVTDNVGTYYPLPPQRILDTRIGLGAPESQVGPGATIDLQVGGAGGVPTSGVSAVVLNVTATNPSSASYVTVFPTGAARPTASSLNLVRYWTGANSVTMGLGTGGQVSLYNNAGSTDLIADVVGFYAADATVVPSLGVGGEYQPGIPTRIFDSRDPYNGYTKGHRMPGGTAVQLWVDYGLQVNPHVRALVVNVTAVDPAGPGYLATWNGIGPVPGTSTLNYQVGATVPNLAVVPTSFCCLGKPSIAVYTSIAANVIVDVTGFIDDSDLGGLRFTPRTPIRIVDTRIGQGASTLGQGATATIITPGAVATSGTVGLALNVTAVNPTASTYVSVWPAIPGLAMPYVSNLNPGPGQIVPNSVYTLIGPTNGFDVYNNAGRTDLVADVVGTFWNPAPTPGTTSVGRPAPPVSALPARPIGSQARADPVR